MFRIGSAVAALALATVATFATYGAASADVFAGCRVVYQRGWGHRPVRRLVCPQQHVRRFVPPRIAAPYLGPPAAVYAPPPVAYNPCGVRLSSPCGAPRPPANQCGGVCGSSPCGGCAGGTAGLTPPPGAEQGCQAIGGQLRPGDKGRDAWCIVQGWRVSPAGQRIAYVGR